jgi:hypothetical protein
MCAAKMQSHAFFLVSFDYSATKAVHAAHHHNWGWGLNMLGSILSWSDLFQARLHVAEGSTERHGLFGNSHIGNWGFPWESDGLGRFSPRFTGIPSSDRLAQGYGRMGRVRAFLYGTKLNPHLGARINEKLIGAGGSRVSFEEDCPAPVKAYHDM